MPASVDEALLEFVHNQFPAGKSVGVDDPLLEGVIDSLGIFTIVGFIETQFQVTFDDRELTVENFKDVRTLSKLVQSKRPAP
jgi:acyl carrier protein